MSGEEIDGLPHLELKIENMLDKLMEVEEENENEDQESSLKFSDDISSQEEEKDDPKENQDFSFNQSFPNEEQEQVYMNSLLGKYKIDFNSSDKSNKQNPNEKLNRNIAREKENNQTKDQSKLKESNQIPTNTGGFINLNSSITPFSFNYLPKSHPLQLNMINTNSYCLDKYPNMSSNTLSTTSISSNYFNNSFNYENMTKDQYYMNNNFLGIDYGNNLFNKSGLFNFGFQDNNKSFSYKNGRIPYNRSKKNHNSYYAGDKKCFNDQQQINKKYGKIETNVEVEILLIEINKTLNKIEKIDQVILNKLRGRFEQIILTHKGSRIFQNYLKNTHNDILHQIFVEIKPKLSELLKDNYANYFCKKFFDCLNQKDRIDFLSAIKNDLSALAIDNTATYPIQGILEQLGSKAEKKIIYLGLKDSISIYCYNIYGTHVLEKMLSYFEDEFIEEIINYVYNNFINLSYHINGICIVKKLLLMTYKKDLHQKLKKIVFDNALNLVVHPYGNYVIQVIVENWEDKELIEILDKYKGKYVSLSMQKYSSNVLERIIEKNEENLNLYIEEICNNQDISEIMRNNFGNYVVQKALKLSTGKNQELLIKEINNNIHKIEDKKIINKWKIIISSKSSSNK